MEDLLDIIAAELKCNYISDLPIMYHNKLTKQFVINIPDEKYSLKKWNDAVNYLLNANFNFSTVAEAKNHLLNTLEK